MNSICPKCEGKMVKGYIADRTDMNMVRKQAWAEGKKPKTGRKSQDVTAYSCEQCGFIELYVE